MSRHLTVPIALILFVPSAESAPKLKDGEKPALYFPTTIGTKRVLEIRVGGKTSELIEVVTAVDKKDDMIVVSVGREEGAKVVPFVQYGVSEKGMFRVSSSGRAHNPPGCLLRLPATPGDTWDEELPVRTKDGPLKMKYTTDKEEDIEVPAGKFRAVRVEAVSQVASSPTQITYWFAAGVGSVKIVYKDTGPKGGERVTVLKFFEPGKK